MSNPHKNLYLTALVAAAILTACDSTGPVGPASSLKKVTAIASTAIAGSTIPGGATVQVLDARGHGVAGSKVTFTVTAGDGAATPFLVVSDGSGMAHAEWTIGQTAGDNTLVAKIDGIDSTAAFTVTGTPGPASAVAVTPHTLRLPAGTTSAAVTGSVVDQYANKVSGTTTTYVSRNPGLVTVDAATGAVTVVGSGGGTTYIVATGSNFKDSSYVIVLKSTDLPCTGITARANLAVGGVMTTGFSDNGTCVDGTTSGAEYALIPYFDSSVPSAQTSFTMGAYGIKTPGVLGSLRRTRTGLLADVASTPSASAAVANGAAFHDRMREAEDQAMPAAGQNARLWYGAVQRTAHRAARATVVPTVGDLMQLNVNAIDFCSKANMHTGRVAAVTQRAVVVADIANPPGFSDAEYQSFGVNFDTLVYSVDVTNFGAPSDIDENGGRVVLFFTHAVNEVGPGVLGYYYGRDLLPKSGPLGTCPGSNVSEIMYLLVPDAQYPKSYVLTNTVGTAAHEFQHLINAARRLYINTNAAMTEERWLNEGLSHVAEELLFYRTSGLAPRQNIGSSALSSPLVAQAFQNYQSNNFGRLKEYLRSPDTQSPIGLDDNDDDFATRGAIWSYLRYVADQRFAATEQTLWFKLVNSNSTGLQNLYEVVGTDARLLMRDWTLGVFLDDLVGGITPKYQQPSWNLRQVVNPFAPVTSMLVNGNTTPFGLRGGGTTFARFGIAANGEAYVSASGAGGTALPKNVLLALVRTK